MNVIELMVIYTLERHVAPTVECKTIKLLKYFVLEFHSLSIILKNIIFISIDYCVLT